MTVTPPVADWRVIVRAATRVTVTVDSGQRGRLCHGCAGIAQRRSGPSRRMVGPGRPGGWQGPVT